MHWTEDYRVVLSDDCFALIHVPSQTVLLRTTSVSMETLCALTNEFDTYGKIRKNWRQLPQPGR